MATGNHRCGKVTDVEVLNMMRKRLANIDPKYLDAVIGKSGPHLYWGHGFPEISRFKMIPPPKELNEKYKNIWAINEASEFAHKKHGNQKDDNGLSYFQAHVVKVADIVRLVAPNDTNLIKAAYLHDTIEDTHTTYDELKQKFGHDVADLVLEVSHEGSKKVGYYFPRLHTQRGIVLKFCDRLNNISRMEPWGRERKEHYIRKSKFWRSEP
jgi:(p)ppGpp synthase/HD superfamily hydrolase